MFEHRTFLARDSILARNVQCPSVSVRRLSDWLSMVLRLRQHNIGYYGRRFLQVWWPNQQCQSTEGGWLVIQTGLNLTMLTSPCYNTRTCLSVTQVDQSKTVKVMIMKFSPYGSPISLVFARNKFHPEILMGSPERGRQTWRDGKTSHFLALSRKQ